MLKKTVSYEDPFDGTPITEDLYFNLTQAEVTKMAMINGEGWAEHLQSLSTATQGKEIMAEFDALLGIAYGKREGNKHVKSPEITKEFLSSEAYSTLFMELLTQPGSGAQFFNEILPKGLDKLAASLPGNAPADPNDKRPAWVREDREPTKRELENMTKAQLVDVMQRRAANA